LVFGDFGMKIKESVLYVDAPDVESVKILAYNRIQVGMHGIVLDFLVGFVGFANEPYDGMIDGYLLDIQFVFGKERFDAYVLDVEMVGGDVVNSLVVMLLFDEPEVCRRVGSQGKTVNLYPSSYDVDFQSFEIHRVETFAVVIDGIAHPGFYDWERVIIAHVLQGAD